MKRNLSDYIVALAVIACSIVLLAALTFALSGYQWKKPTRTLQIDYQDVTGVKVHSEVRYAGAPAGRVIAMRHLNAAERNGFENKKKAVRVTVSIDEDIPPLPVDIEASLGADTMLGQKFVALSAGTPGASTLANNALIEGHPAYSIEEITQAAGPLLDHANELIGNVNGTVTNVKEELAKVLPKISALVDSVQGVSKNGGSLVERAKKLIADNEGDVKKNLEELQKVMTGLEDTLTNAKGLVGNANKFVGSTDKQLQDQMKELHVILLNLKVISTHAKAITEALGEKPNRLIFSGKATKLTPEAAILKSQQPLPAKAP